jgi:hypothetical protein
MARRSGEWREFLTLSRAALRNKIENPPPTKGLSRKRTLERE